MAEKHDYGMGNYSLARLKPLVLATGVGLVGLLGCENSPTASSPLEQQVAQSFTTNAAVSNQGSESHQTGHVKAKLSYRVYSYYQLYDGTKEGYDQTQYAGNNNLAYELDRGILRDTKRFNVNFYPKDRSAVYSIDPVSQGILDEGIISWNGEKRRLELTRKGIKELLHHNVDFYSVVIDTPEGSIDISFRLR